MFEIISFVVGVIGTGIAIYQTAVINESKKRKNELQYLLAGINAAAVQKQQAWQNQISLLQPPNSPEDWKIAQLCVRARDDAMELGNLTSALEGTIDPDNSAIVTMMDKYKKIVAKNQEIKEVSGAVEPPVSTNKSSQQDASKAGASA
ncbi:hypothetical protein Q4575_10785 [Psychrosphaera sp. 1_MG-2023]|uniref:hypothetical protein n=1 Tax=Psychrosphaera sp. 1_MG-2023 TaxID=3062643 RepID=UPI0026E37F9F|nr:hypothetical protein [Psychrosphaera sp. 1_MG-2023]MDO6719890.1 hypothetical protein [Psychrosphaera sp. 1_MG-2023]